MIAPFLPFVIPGSEPFELLADSLDFLTKTDLHAKFLEDVSNGAGPLASIAAAHQYVHYLGGIQSEIFERTGTLLPEAQLLWMGWKGMPEGIEKRFLRMVFDRQDTTTAFTFHNLVLWMETWAVVFTARRSSWAKSYQEAKSSRPVAEYWSLRLSRHEDLFRAWNKAWDQLGGSRDVAMTDVEATE